MPPAVPPNPLAVLVRTLLPLALDAALLALGLGGFGRLASDPRAITLLVIWGAAGLALAWLRPVRGSRADESRPDPAAMVVLLLVPLLTPAAGAFAGRRAWALPPASGALSWIGVALVAAGLALRVAAMARLGPRFSPLVALQPGHALETAGPYARIRHPGYLGALLACLGAAIAFGSLAALPLPAIMLAVQLGRIRAEEALLARHFGDRWSAYAARTGALLPRLAPVRRPG